MDISEKCLVGVVSRWISIKSTLIRNVWVEDMFNFMSLSNGQKYSLLSTHAFLINVLFDNHLETTPTKFGSNVSMTTGAPSASFFQH